MAKDRNPADKADDAMRKQREAAAKTERQINRGSYVCGCGASFGSELLLTLHETGCDGE